MEIIDLSKYIQYIKPELLILIPFLIGVGKIIKTNIDEAKHKHIPLILLAVSVVLSCSWLFVMEGEVFSRSLVSGIVQGGIAATVAVFGNQVFKQYTKSE